MKNLVLLFVVLACISCIDDKNVENAIISHHKPDLKVQLNSKYMLRSDAPELGRNISNFGDIEPYDLPGNFLIKKEFGHSNMYTYYKRAYFKVVIDTNSFYNDGYLFDYPITELKKNRGYSNLSSKEQEEKWNNDRIEKDSLESRKILSHAVRVYNEGKEETPFFNNRMIQEALDIDGKWKPIEYLQWIIGCGNSRAKTPTIKPHHYSMSSIVKYAGNFKTKIRVKVAHGYQLFYSNEIEGYINQSQFIPMIDGKVLPDSILDNEEFEHYIERAFLRYEKYANNAKYITE